jgi:hypothetical protein
MHDQGGSAFMPSRRDVIKIYILDLPNQGLATLE